MNIVDCEPKQYRLTDYNQCNVIFSQNIQLPGWELSHKKCRREIKKINWRRRFHTKKLKKYFYWFYKKIKCSCRNFIGNTNFLLPRVCVWLYDHVSNGSNTTFYHFSKKTKQNRNRTKTKAKIAKKAKIRSQLPLVC